MTICSRSGTDSSDSPEYFMQDEYSSYNNSEDQCLLTKENSIIVKIDEPLGSMVKLVGKSSIAIIFRKLVSVGTLNMFHDYSPT